MFTCFSLKTMDFDVKHLKLLKPLVFGKAIGCPGCVLRSEGWVEQSESCHRKRWTLLANIPQISAKLPQISAKTRKSQNDGELTFSDSQGLGMAPLDSVALSNDTKHLKLQKSLESGNFWFFPGEWISRLFGFCHPQLISTMIRFAQGLIVAAGPNVDSVVSGPGHGRYLEDHSTRGLWYWNLIHQELWILMGMIFT